MVKKKNLTPDSYALWGDVTLDKISSDQKWASFKMRYKNGNDTLFVRNVANLKTFNFPNGKNGGFSSGRKFFCQTGKDLIILDLSNGRKEIIKEISNFDYSEKNEKLLILSTRENKKPILTIRSLKTGKDGEISNIDQISLNKEKGILAYSTISEGKSVLSIASLQKDETFQVAEGTLPFSNFSWQKNGLSLAFTAGNNPQHPQAIYHFIVSEKKLHYFKVISDSNSIINADTAFDSDSPIIISDDLQRLFFSTVSLNLQKRKNDSKSVEIWNSTDKRTYIQQQNADRSKKGRIAVWTPVIKKAVYITSSDLPDLILSGDMRYAVLSNPADYEPQFEYTAPRDFYLMDLQNFEKKLFLKNITPELHCFSASPTGKYFAYFKDGDCWTYNFNTGIHKNITAKIGNKFTAKEQSLVPESVCGSPGWSENDTEILLYDQFDVWAVSPEGNSFKRLTKGRESDIIFRIAKSHDKPRFNNLFEGQIQDSFNLDKDLVLKARGNDEKTGFYIWNKKDGQSSIIYKDAFCDQIIYNEGKYIFFREQKFDMSPRLAVVSTSSSSKYFFKSNRQQDKFFWGRSQLIEYQDSKKNKLKGVLYYPAGYNHLKEYPMIVNIYERKSFELHKYQNPTYFVEGGFNPSVLTSEGYFVLQPDISLEFQNPGISAADCVISAVKKVVESGIIDKKRIGIMGHSFGGYESSFIITQTNIFAAAIASGAITDLVSFYYTINKGNGRPDMWRFHNEEWNMGGPPYEIPKAYYENSPINYVKNVQTPVLLWSGKNDYQVDIHQSIEFHLALRRAGKKSMMLIYPDQGHSLIEPEKQKDLSIRTVQWFDHFLKDDKKNEWVNKG